MDSKKAAVYAKDMLGGGGKFVPIHKKKRCYLIGRSGFLRPSKEAARLICLGPDVRERRKSQFQVRKKETASTQHPEEKDNIGFF